MGTNCPKPAPSRCSTGSLAAGAAALARVAVGCWTPAAGPAPAVRSVRMANAAAWQAAALAPEAPTGAGIAAVCGPACRCGGMVCTAPAQRRPSGGLCCSVRGNRSGKGPGKVAGQLLQSHVDGRVSRLAGSCLPGRQTSGNSGHRCAEAQSRDTTRILLFCIRGAADAARLRLLPLAAARCAAGGRGARADAR